jgi:hypothetical protein
MVVISSGLREHVTDWALIGNRFYETNTERFNLCNGLAVTSVTNSACKGI